MKTRKPVTFKERADLARKLFDNIQSNLNTIDALQTEMGGSFAYEDRIYRYYHHSYKVYDLQDYTVKAKELFESLDPKEDPSLYITYLSIAANGTGKTWERDHNSNWHEEAGAIVEAFFHSMYFVDMMAKYGDKGYGEGMLPSGWAALLHLYEIR